MGNNKPVIVENDPWLSPFSDIIYHRQLKVFEKEAELTDENKNLSDFATGYLYFGIHRTGDGWVLREWAPNATAIYLVGQFNHWEESPDWKLTPLENGVWEIHVWKDRMHHGDLFKLSVHWPGGKGYRLPSYIRRVIQHEDSKVFDAQIWAPEEEYVWQNPGIDAAGRPPFIYEAHVGMATTYEKIGSFDEFRLNILPRIKKAGYNTIQLMAIQEHPYYGSFGYHVSNFFAVSSRFGTPLELKRLIDEAHGMDIAVIMDLVHSHSVKNELEGLANFDGTPYQYFHSGVRREHVAWDSLCFDYGRNEVLHFLLSNCKFWLDEYHFDGFRFDGVTSMLYYDHGLSKNFTEYSMYYDGTEDEDAIVYIALANKMINQVNPGAITIAEEMSGMPGLASSLADGGYGFHFRMAMGVPDYWIKIIKERLDEEWNIPELYYELTSKRKDEKTISYAESHDQALVGDKTLIFRLIDREMYFSMDKLTKNLVVDRGIALHKMIRLITAATGGGGYLNFMGNEFGHPEWIDFPRAGNNWSFQYARRQWNLVDDDNLKYHLLGDFDQDMVHLLRDNGLLEVPYCRLLADNGPDKILAFERGDFVFIFSFNPSLSFTDYGIQSSPGKYRIVLNTDNVRYGGQGLVDESMTYFAQVGTKLNDPHMLRLYLPTRVGMVLKRLPTPRVY